MKTYIGKKDHAYKIMRKHISQAVVLLEMASQLYEQGQEEAAALQKNLAIGHLALASDIIVGFDRALANTIRNERLLIS